MLSLKIFVFDRIVDSLSHEIWLAVVLLLPAQIPLLSGENAFYAKWPRELWRYIYFPSLHVLNNQACPSGRPVSRL